MRPAGFGVIRTPLHTVKLAQMTALCQNGSRLRWLCWSQVRAGICSLERQWLGKPLLLLLWEAAWPIWVLSSLVGSSLQLHVR